MNTSIGAHAMTNTSLGTLNALMPQPTIIPATANIFGFRSITRNSSQSDIGRPKRGCRRILSRRCGALLA